MNDLNDFRRQLDGLISGSKDRIARFQRDTSDIEDLGTTATMLGDRILATMREMDRADDLKRRLAQRLGVALPGEPAHHSLNGDETPMPRMMRDRQRVAA